MKSAVLILTLFALSLPMLAQKKPVEKHAPAQGVSAVCAERERQIEGLYPFLADTVWAFRYADANVELQPPTKNEQRVVFFGDSITDWWPLKRSFGDKPYVNRGIAGQTTPQMLIRLKRDVLELKPKVVVILAGTNDLALYKSEGKMDRAKENLTCMAELARANDIRVVFASVLPVRDAAYPMTKDHPADAIVDMNQWLKNYCDKNGCVYLDYFSKVADEKGLLRADLSEDGLHPNAAGYSIMAPLADAAIQQALSPTPARAVAGK